MREYITKIIHSTRSVQNIPNLSNKWSLCLYMCSEMQTWEVSGCEIRIPNMLCVEKEILLPVWCGCMKQICRRTLSKPTKRINAVIVYCKTNLILLIRKVLFSYIAADIAWKWSQTYEDRLYTLTVHFIRYNCLSAP